MDARLRVVVVCLVIGVCALLARYCEWGLR